MEEQKKEPFHCDRIVMEFQRKAHITDVAFEAVVIAARTGCDVSLRLDGWQFTVTPHMDVPEVIEAYRRQPDWFVGESDGLHMADAETGRMVTQSHATEVQHAATD